MYRNSVWENLRQDVELFLNDRATWDVTFEQELLFVSSFFFSPESLKEWKDMDLHVIT